MAGLIGDPKETDDFTLNLVSLTLSHVKVEVDLTKPLPSVVEFQRQSGEVVGVQVDYPWLPPTCSHCKELGHVIRNCLLYTPPKDPAPEKKQSGDQEKKKTNQSVKKAPTNTVKRGSMFLESPSPHPPSLLPPYLLLQPNPYLSPLAHPLLKLPPLSKLLLKFMYPSLKVLLTNHKSPP